MGGHDGGPHMAAQGSFRREKRMRGTNWLFPILILISIFSLWGCEKEPVANLGDAAQDFTLPTLDGQPITLSQFRGKRIFLLFWTQGCVFCQTRSITLVNDIYLMGQKTDLVVLTINMAGSKGDVSEFIRQKKLIFPVLLDRDASVSRKKFDVYVLPTLFIIGRDGLIKEKAYGYLSEQGLLDLVGPYLKKKN